MKKLFSSILLLFFTLSIFGFSKVSAEGAIRSMSVAPSKITQDIELGESYTETLNIYNKGTTNLNIKPYIKEYEEDENGNPIFLEPEDEDSITEFIYFNEDIINIKSGDSGFLDITINIPEEYGIGNKSAAIFLDNQIDKGIEEETAVAHNIRVIIKISLAINKPGEKLSRSGELLSYDTKIEYNGFLKNPTLSTEIEFKNTGNSFLNFVSYTDYDCFSYKKIRRSGYKNPERKTILPNTTKTMNNRWIDAPFLGICKVTTTYAYQKDDWQKLYDFVIVYDYNLIFIIFGIFLIFVIYSYFSTKKRGDYMGGVFKKTIRKTKDKNILEKKTSKSFVKRVFSLFMLFIIIIAGLFIGQFVSSLIFKSPEAKQDTITTSEEKILEFDFGGYKENKDEKIEYNKILNF